MQIAISDLGVAAVQRYAGYRFIISVEFHNGYERIK